MKRTPQASKARPKKRTTTRKSQYRIRNWHDYNESLVQRGSITLWISEEDIGAWKPGGPRKRGGQFQYSDGAIQCLLMVRSVFHLTLRAAEGFLRSVFHLLEWELPVPGLYHPLQARQAPGGFIAQESCWALAPGTGQHRVESLWGGRMEGASAWLYQTAYLEEAPSERGQ